MTQASRDIPLHICRRCELTKKIHPASYLSSQESCMLCGQSIHHEIQIDKKVLCKKPKTVMRSTGFQKIPGGCKITVDPPIAYTPPPHFDRNARLCSLHKPEGHVWSDSAQFVSCYTCNKMFARDLLYPLLCCNFCKMNGNRCVEYTD